MASSSHFLVRENWNHSVCVTVMFKKSIALGAAALLLADFASAGLVTAYEWILDPLPLDASDRDLTRTRSSAAFFEVENDDAVIVAQNAVSKSFGILGWKDVSYEHHLGWIDPKAASFIDATLTIQAWGAWGDDDKVFADEIFLGTIPMGLGWGIGPSTFTFFSDDGAALDVAFSDGVLKIDIDKNAGRKWWHRARYDKVSIYGSKLKVSYLAVPEPSSLLFAGTFAALALLFVRRRRSA
jgi:hypothetical protein